MLTLALLSGSAAAYAPSGALAPSVRMAPHRAGAPQLNLNQRIQSAALGAALAASLSVGPASAADPWPYSTLVSKVQADEVAKVCIPPPLPNLGRARRPRTSPATNGGPA